jgi:hypothetical protein
MRLGQRAAGQNHDEVLALLRQAGPDGAAIERDLVRLLPPKTKAEYDPDDVPKATARRAVEWAQRCVAVARRVAAWTRPVLNLASSGRSVLCPRDRTDPNWTEERWAQNGHTTHSEGPPFEFQLGWSEPEKCVVTRYFSGKVRPQGLEP